MQNYCYRNRLDFIDAMTRRAIIEFVDSATPESVTSRHDFGSYFPHETGPGLFTFLRLPMDLENTVRAKIPQYLMSDDLFIRVQTTQGDAVASSQISAECVPAHIDRGRKAGMFFLLTNDDSETRFYDWRPNASKNLVHSMVASPAEINCRLKIKFQQNECWFFNHAALHSIHAVESKRVSLNICYENLEFEDLLKLYFNNIPAGE